MKKVELTPEFKDEEELNLIKLIVLITAFVPLFPALAYYFAMANQSKDAKKILAALVNFEIIVVIVCIFALLAPVAWIINLIICLKIVSAISNKEKVEIPEVVKILTVSEDTTPKE